MKKFTLCLLLALCSCTATHEQQLKDAGAAAQNAVNLYCDARERATRYVRAADETPAKSGE